MEIEGTKKSSDVNVRLGFDGIWITRVASMVIFRGQILKPNIQGVILILIHNLLFINIFSKRHDVHFHKGEFI